MSKLESLSRQIYIINFLLKRNADFEGITQHLIEKEAFDDRSYVVSKRTFERDLQEISSLFGYEISYNRSLKKYRIENTEIDNASLRIIEAFDLLNALNHSNSVSQHIYFEQRKPQGTEHMKILLSAISNKKLVGFKYQKFWDDETSERVVEPYALREFKNRWYLVAKDQKDNTIKTFGLDRMTNPAQKSKKFNFPDLSVLKNKFNHCFGVITPDEGEPETIELSFTPFQAKYIKTMPLHHSQEIIEDNETHCLIRLKLFNTVDLRMEILSYGKEVKVVNPKTLTNQIKKMHEEAAKVKG